MDAPHPGHSTPNERSGKDDRAIALPLVGADSTIEELVTHHRETLAALPAGWSLHERGKLHLAIGVYLGWLGESRVDEAIEELRQALALLLQIDTPLDHAQARHHLGRLLLERVFHLVKRDRVTGGRGKVMEAAHHLERAYHLFAEGKCTASRVEAARLWSYALASGGHHDRVYILLERSEHEGEHRLWIELCLAEHALEDPDPARQAQGAEILATYLDQAGGASAGTDDAVISIVGIFHAQLPESLIARALSWLESRPGAPSDVLISLRKRIHPDHPDRWLTPADKARLVGRMDDSAAPVATRAEAAYTLLGVLPKHDTVVQRRVVEQLESWIESPDIHPLQRGSYHHDLALGMRLIADGDPSVLERAIHHFGIALDEFASTSGQPIVARNLAYTLLELLKVRAAVSSPALLPLAVAIEGLAPELPSKNVRDLRLATTDCLLRSHVLTHPACAVMAAALLGKVIEDSPEDADARRMRYLHAWILHAQGMLDQKALDQFLERARQVGEVPTLEPLGDQRISVARALAGNGSLEALDLRLVIAAAAVRPDAVERVLDEVERRFGIPGITGRDRRALLEVAIQAVTASAPGDEGARGRRLAALLAQSEPHLSHGELVHLVHMTHGPASNSMREALHAAGISLDESAYEDPDGADIAQRAEQLQARGIELMQQGQRCMMEHDKSAAQKLFVDAQQVLDEACALVRCLPVEEQAKIQISAGNARRHLAKLDRRRATELLEEAEALYRRAWPWTEHDKNLRAQLAKVLADCLLQQHGGGRWADTMSLYSTALSGRPGGFKRWEQVSVKWIQLPSAAHEGHEPIVAATQIHRLRSEVNSHARR